MPEVPFDLVISPQWHPGKASRVSIECGLFLALTLLYELNSGRS